MSFVCYKSNEYYSESIYNKWMVFSLINGITNFNMKINQKLTLKIEN